ncbi:MAG: 4Fe-4S binding protein [Bacteroidales bacterium]
MSYLYQEVIRIDPEKCNACGICVRICHEYCLHLEKGVVKIDESVCSTCTQCVAICPQQAITWEHHQPEKFDRARYPGPEQMRELFMQRRTIRDYSSRSMDRALLEEIAGYTAYAPTHNFDFRVVILDDAALIGMIDTLIYHSCLSLYRWVYKPRIVQSLIGRLSPVWEKEFLKARPKVEHVIQRKSGFKSTPAAIIFVIGNKRVPLSLESAQYALYNMDLYAQSNGIACRNLVGNQGVINRNRKFRKRIGLNRYEKIFGTMTLGYPAIRYRNKVTGKRIPVQWNSEHFQTGEPDVR